MRKKSHRSRIPFVAIQWEMLNSKAYTDISASPGKSLPYFLGKPKVFFTDPQYYLTEFSFSYSEGKHLGFAPATFSKIIQELVRRGFIEPVDKGGLRSDGKSYNLFKLSQRWKKYGTPSFERIEWRCFLPKPRATSKKEMDRFKKGNKRGSERQTVSQFEAVEAVSR